MLVQCWVSHGDKGATLNQHWVNVSCLLAYSNSVITAKQREYLKGLFLQYTKVLDIYITMLNPIQIPVQTIRGSSEVSCMLQNPRLPALPFTNIYEKWHENLQQQQSYCTGKYTQVLQTKNNTSTVSHSSGRKFFLRIQITGTYFYTKKYYIACLPLKYV